MAGKPTLAQASFKGTPPSRGWWKHSNILKASKRVAAGLVLEGALDKIPEGALIKATGGYREQGGALVSAPGKIPVFQQKSYTGALTDPIVSLNVGYYELHRQIISVGGTRFYVDGFERASGVTNNSRWRFLSYNYWTWAAESVAGRITNPKAKWDGKIYYDWGIGAPTGTASGSASGSGTLSGTYNYKIAFGRYHDGGAYIHYGNPSPVSNSVTASNQQIILSAIPISTDSQVNRRYIYRVGGLYTSYKLVTTLADNTITTYTDNIYDANLGSAMETDRDIPPICDTMVVWRDRIFVAEFGSNRLSWSKTLQPEAFDVDVRYLDVGSYWDDGIMGLASFPDMLVIITLTKIWILTGYDESTFTLTERRKLNESIALDTIASDSDTIYFMSGQGILRYDPLRNNIQDITEGLIKPLFRGESVNGIQPIDPSYVGMANGAIYNDFYVLSYIPVGSTIPNQQLWYDALTSQWYQTSFNISCFAYDRIYNKLLAGSDDGIVYEIDVSKTNFGSPSTFNIQTAYLYNSEDDKLFEQVSLDADVAGENIAVIAHYNSGTSTATLGTLTNTGRQKSIFSCGGQEARNVSIEFSGNISNEVKIYDVSIDKFVVPHETKYRETEWIYFDNKYHMFRKLKLLINAPANVTLNMYANGNQTTPIYTTTITLTIGAQTKILSLPPAHKYNSIKISLVSTTAFKVYYLKSETKQLDKADSFIARDLL